MLLRSPVVDGRRTLTFILPHDWAGRASVVGNFNGWVPGALPFEATDADARASVELPHNYIAVFRYLGAGDHWFDEPDADVVDRGGSVVWGADELAAGPERTLSPAEHAVHAAARQRKKEAKAAEKARKKGRKKSGDPTSPVAKAASKRQRSAKRVADEHARSSGKKKGDKAVKADKKTKQGKKAAG